MKKLITAFLALALCLSFTACSKQEEEPEETGMNIMFVVTGSLGGGNNVDDVKSALDEFVADKGGTVDYVECKMDTTVYQSNLETAADSGKYDLIVTGFGTMVEPLTTVALAYPDQKFLLFDAALDFTANSLPNCISVQALGNQGGFLAGALAALIVDEDETITDKAIGFIGATESIAILDFFFGYVTGAKYVNENMTIFYSVVGDHKDSAGTLEIAKTQNANGAMVIFGATNSDLAVADAALEKDFLAICCDTDEAANHSDPEEAKHIITSVIKDYKGMVTPVLYEIADGTASWGSHSYISYGQGGVRLADTEFGELSSTIIDAYNTIAQDLADGKIDVPTAYGADADAVAAIKALCK